MRTFQKYMHESRRIKTNLPLPKIKGIVDPPIAIDKNVFESYEWDDGNIEATVELSPADPETGSQESIEVIVTKVVVSQIVLYKKDSNKPYIFNFEKTGVPTWAKGIVDEIMDKVETMKDKDFDTADVDFTDYTEMERTERKSDEMRDEPEMFRYDEAMASGAVTGLPTNLGTYQRVYPSPLAGSLRPKWNKKKKRKLKETSIF